MKKQLRYSIFFCFVIVCYVLRMRVIILSTNNFAMVLQVCYKHRNAVTELNYVNGNFQSTKSIHSNRFYCRYRKPDQIPADTFDCIPWTKMRSNNVSLAQRTYAFHNYPFAFDIRNGKIYCRIRKHSSSVRCHNSHYMLPLWDSLTGKRVRRDCHMFSLSIHTLNGRRYHQNRILDRSLYRRRYTVHRIGKL